MNKVTIVHAADMHFDTPFKEIGIDKGNISREELKEVFSNIIEFCVQKKVQILLIAGDIFDNMSINKSTVYFLETIFKKLTDTRVFISPGNHDPYGLESFYHIINWPSNVHIFKSTELEKINIEELNVCIWGAAFTNLYQHTSLLSDISVEQDKINIMVIHGEVVVGQEKSEYNPISISNIQNSQMDYIALGHRHEFSSIKTVGSTSYAYSGCIQGRGFDEIGDKGIIYGEVYKKSVNLNFVKMSKRNYYIENIDVSNASDYEDIKQIIISKIDKDNRSNNFYKIILVGQIIEQFNIDVNVLYTKIQTEFYYVKIVDKTSKIINLEKISKGYSVKSIFVKKLINELQNTQDSNQKEIINMALNLGIQSMTEEEIKIL